MIIAKVGWREREERLRVEELIGSNKSSRLPLPFALYRHRARIYESWRIHRREFNDRDLVNGARVRYRAGGHRS